MSEWGPWIDGSVLPPDGAYIQMDVVDRLGRGDITHECIVLGFDGEHVNISPLLPFDRDWEIDQYRIRRPKGMAILEQLLADIPAPVAPEVVG